MTRRPVVLLHGYSDRGESFHPWRDALVARGWDATEVPVASYVSKTNEVTIPDLGEAMDRALRTLESMDETTEFDAVVHSTGMLVLREWMSRSPARRARVKHVVGLAPATWGSPLAHKGRSVVGALFKGNRDWGPDFLEAGDQILRGLELASDYTWRLAEQDLLGDAPAFGAAPGAPWAFVLVGDEPYSGLRRIVNAPGTDGTVRWAGVAFNSRKIEVDLTATDGRARVHVAPWLNTDTPLVFVPGRNHGSILSDPDPATVDLVVEALAVEDLTAYTAWGEQHAWHRGDPTPDGAEWQQFVIRARDERGDPVPDWFLELCTVDADGELRVLEDFEYDVHRFSGDPSYRAFHVDAKKLREHGSTFAIRLMASTGTDFVAYHGVGSQTFDVDAGPAGEKVPVADPTERGWDAVTRVADAIPTGDGEQVTLFYPFTTTLLELTFNREPLPPVGENKVLRFLGDR